MTIEGLFDELVELTTHTKDKAVLPLVLEYYQLLDNYKPIEALNYLRDKYLFEDDKK